MATRHSHCRIDFMIGWPEIDVLGLAGKTSFLCSQKGRTYGSFQDRHALLFSRSLVGHHQVSTAVFGFKTDVLQLYCEDSSRNRNLDLPSLFVNRTVHPPASLFCAGIWLERLSAKNEAQLQRWLSKLQKTSRFVSYCLGALHHQKNQIKKI